MRCAFDPQLRLDCPVVPDVRLNTDCRDEIIPILRALQHIYGRPELRDELLDAVAQDVNATTRADQGRPGMDYWSILVLGAVRARVRPRLRPAPGPRRGAPLAATDHGHRRLVRRPDVRLAMPPRQHLPAVSRHDRAAQPPDRRRGASARPRGRRDGPGRLVRRRHRRPLSHRFEPHRRRPPHDRADGPTPGRPPGGGWLASARAPAPRREEAPPRHQPDRREQGA